MLGLFGAMDMASHALSIYQEATSVAGNNLANVNNPAYSRQKLDINSATPLNTNIGQEGTGVTATSISQIRNALLDSQIAAEGGTTSSLITQQQALQHAEALLSEQITNSSGGTAASNTGISAKLSAFFNNLQKLTASPKDLGLRKTVLQSAQDLTNQLNNVSAGLTAIRDSLNTSIYKNVDTANKTLGDIAELNKQILLSEAGGGSANDLVDQRQAKIEDLSKLINFTATTQTNGSIDISLGGASLVLGGAATNKLVATDIGSGLVVIGNTGGPGKLPASSGSIGGAITTRDGALYDLQSSLDTLSSSLVFQINTVYSAGYDQYGNTGGTLLSGTNAATISVNSSVIADPNTFQASSLATDKGNNQVAAALATLANQTFSGLGNQTFSGNYSATVAALGSSISSATNDLTSTNSVTNMLTQQRNSISGVNTDEELTNIVQFQKAYEASAKLVSTLSAMLETVISMKN
jgi:flagellar hook-associated protein 1 FlgK